MKHFHITFKPDGEHISIHAGATILEAASQCGIILNTACGGCGTCEKCVVQIAPDNKNILACQHIIASDLTVTIPQTSRLFEQRILQEGIDTKSDNSIYHNYADPASEKNILGLAVDIGTTTVVAKLVDLANGNTLSTAACLNPQTRFGDDCISRIAYAKNDELQKQLQETIIDCINDLLNQLCKKASQKNTDIYEASIVANTAMNHLLLGLPVTQLGQAPYEPASVEATDLKPGDLKININPAGNIHTAANIAGFVGADITAAALASDIASSKELTLLIDIGTNGEIILGDSNQLYAASCAAGPAFEGARITHGSRAAAGAIEAVVINDDDIDLDVIGETHPRSICGSGLIDAVAVLLELNILDSTGAFCSVDSLKDNLPPKILARLTQHDSQPAFILYNGDDNKVLLTQKDIRQFQLAKAAIQAGIKVLQKKLKIADDDIKQILLAGAFGNYIRKQSALRIGLIPAVGPERIHFIGNAACSGAKMILLSKTFRENAKRLAASIEYIELATQKDFQALYADSMIF
jgi:uncharacterized 2Fe-2S/4Fe-4S cluster protein (DUF4445 family)